MHAGLVATVAVALVALAGPTLRASTASSGSAHALSSVLGWARTRRDVARLSVGVWIALGRHQPIAPQVSAPSQLKDRGVIDRTKLEEHHLIGRYVDRVDVRGRHPGPTTLHEKSDHVQTAGVPCDRRQMCRPDRGFAPIPLPGRESSVGNMNTT